jgi:hypothetical protein
MLFGEPSTCNFTPLALCPSCKAFCDCNPILFGVAQIKHNYRHETDGAQVERSKVAKALCKESERYLKQSRSMRAGLKNSLSALCRVGSERPVIVLPPRVNGNQKDEPPSLVQGGEFSSGLR